MLAGVQFENEIVETLTEDSAGKPSNVVAVLAGPAVPVNVPLHNPSVACVADVPMAVKVMDSPFAVIVFTAARKGNACVDETGPVAAGVPPPPPPPQPVRTDAARAKPKNDVSFMLCDS